jgi:AraC-like DNA-binding protein
MTGRPALLAERPRGEDMDALSEVLRAVRLTGAIFFDVQATAPWVAETPRGQSIVAAMFPGSDHLICYHVVTQGSCWADVPGESPVMLRAGDIILLPQGDTHVLSSAVGLRRSPDMTMYRRPENGVMPTRVSICETPGTDAEPAAQFVCGFLGCDARPYNPLLAALPRVIRVGPDTGGTTAAFIQLAVSESRQPRIGAQGVLSRLSELMFVDVVRRYLESLPSDRTDWLSGLRDPYLGRALGALHAAPSRAWTLETLAQEANLSRSAFAERFSQFVGKPPMQYLTDWRMQLAANQLRGGNERVAVIAERVGYESEAAFSRAFKRATGLAPGEWRRSRTPGEEAAAGAA